MAVELSTKVPFLDKLEAAVFTNGDQDFDAMLDAFKKAIETRRRRRPAAPAPRRPGAPRVPW
jgi:hypothetical protein